MANYPLRFTATVGFACCLMLLSGCAEHVARLPKIDSQKPFFSTQLTSPVPNDAIDQRLVSRPDGEVLLSWWQKLPNDKRSFLVSKLQDGDWTKPLPVTDMVNVVDAQVVPVGKNDLAALWMVSQPAKSGEGEVHELYTARSDMSAVQWSKPLRVNQEAATSSKESPALAAAPDGTLLASWIDMRNYKMIPPTKAGEEMKSEGFTSLMVARVAADNASSKEMLVDKDFCECCGPALVTDNHEGGLLVYRELQPGNVRDPAIMRITNDNHSQSTIVHSDHWVIEGCPSRGPAIARMDKTVGVAWLTTIKDKAQVRMAFSNDDGHHFAAPIDLEPEKAVSVSGIEIDSPHSALVVWTSTGKQGEMTKLARVYDDGRIEHRTIVHELTDGKAYKWPGPRMTKANDSVIIGWNDEAGKKLGLVKVQLAE
jgi:hypothetical protein